MEYEQSVLFGQYHEKLATFARLQSQRQKTSRRGIRSDEFVENKLHRRFLDAIFRFGNWPLLFFLGILVSFASFLVDIATIGLFECES